MEVGAIDRSIAGSVEDGAEGGDDGTDDIVVKRKCCNQQPWISV